MFWKKAWKKRLYADAAAATPLGKAARKELLRLLDLYGNPGALHKEAIAAKKELERARQIIADSIGAHSDEIVFTSGGTEGNNLAIHGVLRPMLWERGEAHAITSAIEHRSVLETLRALERDGLYITELTVSGEGLVDPKAVVETVNEQTAFISIQLVNSEIGTIEPLREIAKYLRKVNQKIYFHTDASQAPLWLKINVEQLHVDLMTLDAQKVLGPKGVGALYIRRGTPIESLSRGTENTPLAGAFAAALEDAQKNAEANSKKISEVRDYLWGEIKKLLPDAILHGPRIKQGETLLQCSKVSPCYRVANNLNVSIPNLDGEMAVIALDAEGIAVSTRSVCGTGEEEPSHVIEALGVPKELAKTAVRITLLPDATRADARRIARVLADVTARYRQK